VSAQTKVAVIGAGGTMGLPMARNIAAAGIPVRAWNRSPEKLDRLAVEGIEIADSPAAAAEGAAIVLTMVSDADAVIESMSGDDGGLAGAGQGAIWLQMSTIGIEGTERCAELAREAKVELVDAPVAGTREPADEGKLVVFASGPQSARPRCEPVFDAVGQRTIWVGEAGSGTRLKLVVNAWLVSVVEGLAETLALADGLAVDPKLFLDAISGGGLDLPYAQLKGKMMIEGNFDPSFKLALAAKDARLVDEAANRHGLDLPLLTAIRRRLEEGVEEHGEEDMSATFLTAAPSAARAAG
jgi:3-hydroxyisobutyrate dehydrogenase